jgi:cytochrome c-type biogenesis protein CcmE
MSSLTDNDDYGFPELDTPDGYERRPSRVPLIALGAAVLIALVAVGYTMFTRSVVYYNTPTEVLGKPGEVVRLSGEVVDGSITPNAAAGTVTFEVADEQTSVAVLYQGPMPDTLRDEATAVVEGSLGADGVFHADTLFAKCPSKFEAKTTETQ